MKNKFFFILTFIIIFLLLFIFLLRDKIWIYYNINFSLNNKNNINMKWCDKLKEWETKPLKYPKNIKKRFFYESIYITNLNDIYQDIFIESDKFNNLKMDYSSFNEHINKSNNKYVIDFFNLSKKSLLIIPMPKKNKDFTTMKDFIDNASEIQQKKFWEHVSKCIKTMLLKHNKIYVSTHGLNVPYFHLRIDLEPKYYITKKFM